MQTTLDFQNNASFVREDFFVTPSNEEAMSWLNKEWDFLIIYGSKSCGKTHLAHIWKEMVSAEFTDLNQYQHNYLIAENIEKVDEEKLFHSFNHIKNTNGRLLMTSSEAPQCLDIKLQDLKSRLNSVFAVEIKEPDDLLLRVLLRKHFADRQLKVSEDVISYILSRIERSFSATQKIVNDLDILSMQEKRNITIPFIGMLQDNDL